MQMIKMGAALLAAGAMATAHAQPTTLAEGFDNVAGLTDAGWVFTNLSNSAGQNWFQGNEGIFEAKFGAPNSYAAVNFNSTMAANGMIDNWLISPEISLQPGASFGFFTRASDAGFFDTLELRFSSGASSDTASFTTLIASVGSQAFASYPTGDWVYLHYTLPEAASGRIAFRYVSGDAWNASYVGIDSLFVNGVPEPGTALMLALGLAGVVALRRRNRA